MPSDCRLNVKMLSDVMLNGIILIVVGPNGIMLSFNMLNVTAVNVVMLNAIILSVVAPQKLQKSKKLTFSN